MSYGLGMHSSCHLDAMPIPPASTMWKSCLQKSKLVDFTKINEFLANIVDEIMACAWTNHSWTGDTGTMSNESIKVPKNCSHVVSWNVFQDALYLAVVIFFLLICRFRGCID